MLETIGQPREAVKEYAPKIHVFKINPEKIKEVIGKGGEVIDKIIIPDDQATIEENVIISRSTLKMMELVS